MPVKTSFYGKQIEWGDWNLVNRRWPWTFKWLNHFLIFWSDELEQELFLSKREQCFSKSTVLDQLWVKRLGLYQRGAGLYTQSPSYSRNGYWSWIWFQSDPKNITTKSIYGEIKPINGSLVMVLPSDPKTLQCVMNNGKSINIYCQYIFITYCSWLDLSTHTDIGQKLMFFF